MSDERVVSLAEVKEILDEESKNRELSNEQKIALDHATRTTKLTLSQAQKLFEELKGLEFVTDSVAWKIVDMLPVYPEDVRVLFAKERLILDKKQIDAIIAVVKKHV
jgi:DNA-directed RNA polymerase subunit F